MRITNTETIKTTMKEMGTRIKDTRLAINITQSDLAKMTGLSTHSISRLEEGENVSLKAFLLVLRSLGLLENINLLVSEYELRPTDIMQQKKKPQRASRKSDTFFSNSPAKNSEQGLGRWEWGDEQ